MFFSVEPDGITEHRRIILWFSAPSFLLFFLSYRICLIVSRHEPPLPAYRPEVIIRLSDFGEAITPLAGQVLFGTLKSF